MTQPADRFPENARILIVRPDRIGDVVLSTPVVTSIRRARPGWHIAMLLRPMVAPLLAGHPDIDEVITLVTDDKPSFSNTRPLARKLADKRFDIVLHLYSDFWVSLAAFRAGISTRIGPASKIARVFYNISVTQGRSKGDRHESEYNLDLLKELGIPQIRKSSIAEPGGLPGSAARLLVPGGKNVGVFPGMGGSARNWKPEKYAQLIGELSDGGINMILIGGTMDLPALERVENALPSKPKKFVCGNLKELAAVIKALDCFVAPSTGPLHIATAVGTPVVGIYCPIRVCHPRRWGPIGPRDIALVPGVPECEHCTAEKCLHYDCMDSLPVSTAVRAVRERLGGTLG